MYFEALYFSLVYLLIKLIMVFINGLFNKNLNQILKNKSFFINLLPEIIVLYAAYLILIYLSSKIDGTAYMVQIFVIVLFITIIRLYNFVVEPYILLFNSKRRDDYSKILDPEWKKDMKIIVIESDQINAYATGFIKSNSIIILTTKLLECMNKEDIKNLIKHEIGHLKEKHLFILFLINIIGSTITILASFQIIEYFKNSQFEVLFIGLFIGTISFFLIIVIPGIAQKLLEFRADLYAIKEVGLENYTETLKNFNELNDKALEKWSLTHPTLDRRLKYLNKVYDL